MVGSLFKVTLGKQFGLNLQIQAELFTQGYFEQTSDHSIQLRESNLVKTNKVRDTNKFLKEKSAIVGIQKDFMAPLLKKEKKVPKDTLEKWYGMEAQVMTPELQREVDAIRLRH